jgi:transglutaminase-like putative cysteine protease
MILRIRHRTRFEYDGPAYESHNEVRLAPADGPGQRCLAFTLATEPRAAVLEYVDAFGNRAHAVSVHAPHDALEIVADAVVERADPPASRVRDLSFAEFLAEDDAHLQEHSEFLGPSRYVPLGDRLRRFFWQARPGASEGVGEYTARLVAFVRDQFEYEGGRTDVHSTVEDVLATGGGVCQDFAHLTIGLLRLAGVPARYVSGYLASLDDPPAASLGREQATHAWIEALLPGSGWTGFDPTHRGRIGLQHVRIGVGRDYADVPPLRGVYRSRGRTQAMGVDVRIEELDAWPAAPAPGAEQ